MGIEPSGGRVDLVPMWELDQTPVAWGPASPARGRAGGRILRPSAELRSDGDRKSRHDPLGDYATPAAGNRARQRADRARRCLPASITGSPRTPRSAGQRSGHPAVRSALRQAPDDGLQLREHRSDCR